MADLHVVLPVERTEELGPQLEELFAEAEAIELTESPVGLLFEVTSSQAEQIRDRLLVLELEPVLLADQAEEAVPPTYITDTGLGYRSFLSAAALPIMSVASTTILAAPGAQQYWIKPCSKARAVANGSTTYSESVRGKPTKTEKTAALQKAFVKAFKEASESLARPDSTLNCRRGCDEQYKIILPEFEITDRDVVAGKLNISLGAKGEGPGGTSGGVTGTLTVNPGRLWSDIDVEVQWVILGACVEIVAGAPPSPPAGGPEEEEPETGPVEVFGDGTAIEVDCGSGQQRDATTLPIKRHIVTEPTGGMIDMREARREQREALTAAADAAAQEVFRQAAEDAQKYLETVPACVAPCPKETLSMTIGPIEVRSKSKGASAITAMDRWNTPSGRKAVDVREITASCLWYAERICRR